MPIGKVLTAEDRRVHLPWWGKLCVIFGTVLLGLLFVHFGRFDLARPSLMSAGMIATAIGLRWKMRRRVWFWMTMIASVALHLLLIVFVPWPTKWVPALLIAPIGIADVYAMLWVLSVVGRLMEEPKASDDDPASSGDTTAASR